MEQAAIVHLRLRGGWFGARKERNAVVALKEKLGRIIEESSAGECDGDEFGDDECVLYMYGPDADYLFEAIEPVLRTTSVTSGGYAIKRYGAAEDPNSAEVRVAL